MGEALALWEKTLALWEKNVSVMGENVSVMGEALALWEKIIQHIFKYRCNFTDYVEDLTNESCPLVIFHSVTTPFESSSSQACFTWYLNTLVSFVLLPHKSFILQRET